MDIQPRDEETGMTELEERVGFHKKAVVIEVHRDYLAITRPPDEGLKTAVLLTTNRPIPCGVSLRESLPAAEVTEQPDNKTPYKREPDEESAYADEEYRED